MSACPKGGQHTYRKVSEGGGYITHRCTKCGDTIRRKQGKGRKSLRDRVFSRLIIEPEAGCLLWQGGRTKGYGVTSENQRPRYVHRLMYEWFTGPIPEGMELDHLCRVKHCAAPAHLEAVPHAVNIRRGDTGKYQAVKKECLRGHPYDEANTYYHPNGNRYCRRCKLDQQARARANKRPKGKATS